MDVIPPHILKADCPSMVDVLGVAVRSEEANVVRYSETTQAPNARQQPDHRD